MAERKTQIRSTPLPRQYAVRLTPVLSERVETLARREANPVSTVIRRLIVQGLNKAHGDEAA